MLLATVSSGAYKFVKFLHVLGAITGFGAVFFNGVYAARARKAIGSTAGVALKEANWFVSDGIAQWIIYAVFVLGFALVGMSDKVWKFDQAWIGASMGLFIVGIALVHAVLRPGEKRMRSIQASLSEGSAHTAEAQTLAAEYDKLFQRVAIVGGGLDVILIVIVFLMVVKPGV